MDIASELCFHLTQRQKINFNTFEKNGTVHSLYIKNFRLVLTILLLFLSIDVTREATVVSETVP